MGEHPACCLTTDLFQQIRLSAGEVRYASILPPRPQPDRAERNAAVHSVRVGIEELWLCYRD
jgi:hypothetical protein